MADNRTVTGNFASVSQYDSLPPVFRQIMRGLDGPVCVEWLGQLQRPYDAR